MVAPDFKAFEESMNLRAGEVVDVIVRLLDTPKEDRSGRERLILALRKSLIQLQTEPVRIVGEVARAAFQGEG